MTFSTLSSQWVFVWKTLSPLTHALCDPDYSLSRPFNSYLINTTLKVQLRSSGYKHGGEKCIEKNTGYSTSERRWQKKKKISKQIITCFRVVSHEAPSTTVYSETKVRVSFSKEYSSFRRGRQSHKESAPSPSDRISSSVWWRSLLIGKRADA